MTIINKFLILRIFTFGTIILAVLFLSNPTSVRVEAQAGDPPAIDWASVDWADTNVGSWQVTSQIQSVTFSGRDISFPHTKAGVWPSTTIPMFGPDVPLEGNLWVFAYRNGSWHAATAEWLRPNQTTKGTSNITDACGALHGALSRFSPAPNELMGFMVSGLARTGDRSVEERSDVYMQRWIGVTGSSGDNCTGGSPVVLPTPQPQTPMPSIPPPDCDPLPEDPELLLECNYFDLNGYVGPTYSYGEDPSNPVSVPMAGTAGISGAYSSSNNKVLIVAADVITDSNRPIRGVIVNGSTFAQEKGPFIIDRGMGGGPLVKYDPDQDRFLVLWSKYLSNNTNDIYGRFVSNNGDPVGNAFPVMQSMMFLDDLDYNPIAKKFVVMMQNVPGTRNIVKTIDATGQVSSELVLPRQRAQYEGQGHLTINTNLNQYWIAMNSCNASDSTVEDCIETFYKVDIATGQQVGQPIGMTKEQLGHNVYGVTNIDYSAEDGAAIMVWYDSIGQGLFGKTIYDNGNISDEHEILTPRTFPFTPGGFGGGKLTYNPWTNTFFDVSEDDTGGTIMVEFTSAGLVLNTHQAIAPPPVSLNAFDKFVRMFVSTAKAAYGTFNPTLLVTPSGAIVLGTVGYERVVFTNTPSLFQASLVTPGTPPSSPNPPAPIDTSTLPKLINQIYVWGLGLSVLLALLMMILGGYYLMTSAGNAEQATKGKEYITSAIIGVVIIFTAYLLLNQINPDLVKFNINSLQGLRPN